MQKDKISKQILNIEKQFTPQQKEIIEEGEEFYSNMKKYGLVEKEEFSGDFPYLEKKDNVGNISVPYSFMYTI